MSDTLRGVIRNREQKKQLNDFSGLTFGKITPTDIDFMLEINNKVFIFGESKYGCAKMPYGQKLALERLCDSINKPSYLLICKHDTPLERDIDYANIHVVFCRCAKKWYEIPVGVSLRSAIERILIRELTKKECERLNIYRCPVA